MRLRTSLAAVLALLAAAAADAAPAPFPKPGGNEAEVVLEAQTEERARLAVIYLRSKYMIEMLSKAGVDKAWREKQPTIEVMGTRVRVRVAGTGNALVVLRSVSDLLTGEKSTFGRDRSTQLKLQVARKHLRTEYARRLNAMRMLEGRGNITKEELGATELTLARYEFEAEPMTVHQAPQRTRRGR